LKQFGWILAILGLLGCIWPQLRASERLPLSMRVPERLLSDFDKYGVARFDIRSWTHRTC